MVKAHKPILWQNSPSVQTPINEKNLNQMDSEIGVLDNRIITLDVSKANTIELNDCITSVSYNNKTGQFIFFKKNGSALPINTGLSQIAVNLDFDEKTQEFIIYLSDGTQKRIDVSAFITTTEFLESETITWQLLDNGKVIANIKNNSIKGYMLEPNYLANVMSYSEQAELSAEEAEDSAIRAEEAAEKATAAVGGDFATNTKVDNIINGTTPVAKATDADTVGGKHASDFLSTKGGTVRDTTPAPFNIDNQNVGEILSLIGYYAEGAQLGLLGFYGTNNPVFYSTAGTINSLHYDGNSAKVILDDSAPTDNTALWIDTVNKKVKAHIDGAWTVVA